MYEDLKHFLKGKDPQYERELNLINTSADISHVIPQKASVQFRSQSSNSTLDKRQEIQPDNELKAKIELMRK